MSDRPVNIEAPKPTAKSDFLQQIVTHQVISVKRVLFADGDTPVNIYRKVADAKPGTFLLESAEQGGVWTRFSFVGCGSYGVLTESEGQARWIDYGLPEERVLQGGVSSLSPLDALAAVYERWASPAANDLPPLAGGLVGFIGWEAVREIEHLPTRLPANTQIPKQALSFVAELVVIDHKTGALILVANVLNDGTHSADEMWRDAQTRLDTLQQNLATPSSSQLSAMPTAADFAVNSATSENEFLDMVSTAKQYIHDGDIFQVVLSQRFELACEADSLDVYRMLRHLNPSPYLYLFALETTSGSPYSIVGSSPEALVTVQSGRVMTHPIAGSRPRGVNADHDFALESDLLGDAKERAEHLMLVDLSRNDLLKVCEPASLEVCEFMRVERFSHIMHIVSTVEGDMRADKNSVDAFKATFPAGTLSGAPKPRALEIIDELELSQRGVYGGVVGYFGLNGDADLAIAIRTATIVDGTAFVQAGAGIVADSDPQSEYQECRSKAAAPLRAVALANSLRG